MYPGQHAVARADQPAFIMAQSGEVVTYGELEARSNRLAHLLRAWASSGSITIAIFMENHVALLECCAAGERAGLYYTAINSFLTPKELAYIVNNSLSQVLITSQAKREVALAALRDCPDVKLVPDRRRAGRERARPQSRRGDRALSLRRRSPTKRSAWRCCIPPARRAGPRACCGRCRSSRRRQPLPLYRRF